MLDLEHARMVAAGALDDRPVFVPWTQRSLYVEVTNRCNSLCVHCPRTFNGLHWDRDLTIAEFVAVTDQLPDLERIVLHGLGEPLLNPQLFEMIALLKARGVRVVFNSNAIALSARLRQRVVQSGLDEYRVSFDAATPETYAKIRGVPGFGKAVHNVRALLALKQSLGATTPHVSLWFVTIRENVQELADFVRLAAEIGAPEIHIQRLVYFGEGLAVEEQSLFHRLADEEQRQIDLAEQIAADFGVVLSASGNEPAADSLSSRPALAAHPWWTCRRPWQLSYVTAEGEVLACCFVPFVTNGNWKDQVLGNVREQSLAEIWNGDRYQAFRRQFLSDRPPAICAGCGSKWSV
ncbi:MAG: radical SAM protein [Dehalococcoidia bacterium]